MYEILVVDGMSEDKTREIVNEYCKKNPLVRIIDNPQKIVPTGLNIGIQNAKGEVIIRMDAHAIYDRSYIKKSVDYLNRYSADNVGGIWRIIPRKSSFLAKAIALISVSRFGVGNAHYRIGKSKTPKWVDTVFGGCYRREVFDRMGFFNENLVRTQDLEFNFRLRKSGGKILLVPDIVTYYYVRSDLKSFLKYNFVNSLWITYPIKFLNYMPVSWRHLVPLAFVSGLIGSLFLSVFSKIFLWLFFSIVGFYMVTNFSFSTMIAFREREIKYLFVIPTLFTILHLSYGFGSFWGLMKVLGEKIKYRR
jgi:GT2 family glycosyltransferase